MNDHLFELYKHTYLPKFKPGYVVYRDIADTDCSIEELATAHKVALFVQESDALDFCKYRNEMTEKYGTDDASVIEHGPIERNGQ